MGWLLNRVIYVACDGLRVFFFKYAHWFKSGILKCYGV